MQRLLQFLYRYRSFLLFLFLESLSFWLVVENNSYQGAKYFNSANAFTATVSEASSGLRNFFDLGNQNRILAEENSRLRKRLNILPDSLSELQDTVYVDTALWTFIPAKVINNSVFLQNNHITLNKGTKDGVYKGMGVVGPGGVVGQVTAVTQHFSSLTSLLHSASIISTKHINSGSLCSTSWDGTDPLFASIKYLPRHVNLSAGDTMITSGYNHLYPPETMIGIVDEMAVAENATFYDVKVKLSTDFYNLSYVYLLNYNRRNEQDSIEYIQSIKYE
ncbi:MAG: rod shape-determining protein MreC [Cyclobacteriaceae bacterium]